LPPAIEPNFTSILSAPDKKPESNAICFFLSCAMVKLGIIRAVNKNREKLNILNTADFSDERFLFLILNIYKNL
jgi:hypothetical protein